MGIRLAAGEKIFECVFCATLAWASTNSTQQVDSQQPFFTESPLLSSKIALFKNCSLQKSMRLKRSTIGLYRWQATFVPAKNIFSVGTKQNCILHRSIADEFSGGAFRGRRVQDAPRFYRMESYIAEKADFPTDSFTASLGSVCWP
jgi:hypothetical protein